MFDIFQGGAVIGLVAQDGGDEKARDNDEADEKIGAQQDVFFHNKEMLL